MDEATYKPDQSELGCGRGPKEQAYGSGDYSPRSQWLRVGFNVHHHTFYLKPSSGGGSRSTTVSGILSGLWVPIYSVRMRS
jgi:hypothetical protein